MSTGLCFGHISVTPRPDAIRARLRIIRDRHRAGWLIRVVHPLRKLVLSVLTKRSFSLSGHRTSVALEPLFWQTLTEIAAARGLKLSGLVAAVDAERAADAPLASALRVLALREARGEGRSEFQPPQP